MVDNRSPEKRSATMRAVRGKDTGPEMTVRILTHRMGYRYRLHCKDLPGKPDLVFPSRHKVIFVHGCFWHAHGCSIGQPPKSHLGYWLPKLERNRERDVENIEQLKAIGWSILIIWQCETENENFLAERISNFLDGIEKPRSTLEEKPDTIL